MKKLIAIILAAAVGGGLGTAAAPHAKPFLLQHAPAVAARVFPEVTQAAKPATPAAPAPIEIAASETFTVKPVTLRFTVPFSGSLKPVEQTTVKSQVAAQVGEVLVEEGEAVKKGDTLVRIDMSDLESALNERIANLEAAQAQLANTKKNRDAKVKLAQKGYAARLTVSEAESGYEAGAANVRALPSQVDAAKRALAQAEGKAPMSGIVAERTVNPGDKVSLDTTLLTIVSLDEMEIDAPVPVSEIARVAVGQPVSFGVPGLGDTRFEGAVSRINPVARTGTRSIPVHIKAANDKGLLRGGMFVSGEIVVEEAAEVLAVPAEAIRGTEDDPYVLKLDHGRILRQQVERQGEPSGGLVAVTGLDTGDTIVAARAIELPPETPIRVSER